MTRRVGIIAAVLTLVASPTAAQQSWGIGVLKTGAIVFCDPGRNTVWKVDPDGTRTAALSGVNCRAVVSAPDGNVYGEAIPSEVAATRGFGIWQLDGHGAHHWVMPPTLAPAPGLSLVHDPRGSQFAWTGIGAGSPRSEIVTTDPSGASIVTAGGVWGQADGVGRDASFGNIGGIALAPDGSLVVADSGNIRRVSPLSVVRSEAIGVVTNSHLGRTNTPGLWGRELGVATDASGAAVVVDPEAGRVVHVNRDGRATPIWEPAGFSQRVSGGRWGWRPVGVAMMGRSYYVLDEWMGPALLSALIGSPRLSQVDEGRVTRILSIGDWTVRLAASALAIVLISAVWSRRRRN